MKKWYVLFGILSLVLPMTRTDALESFEQQQLFFFQKLPKAELHLHLSGSYPKEYLFSIASQEQREQLERALLSVSQKVDYHDVFSVFQLVNQIIDSETKVQKGVEALCISLRKDGVSYAEIRSGLKNLKKGNEAYLVAILAGIKAQSSPEFQAKVLLSLQRNSPINVVRETIDLALKYQNEGVVGIDLSGDSTLGEVDLILPELVRARERGLPFVVHIGESPKEKRQIELLTALQPIRVGHGVYLSPEAADWMIRNAIPLEVCLTSSVLVQMIDCYDQHPGLQFFRKGHPIVFCTDDPLLFSTSLSEELLHAHRDAGLSQEEVSQIARDSLRYKTIQ